MKNKWGIEMTEEQMVQLIIDRNIDEAVDDMWRDRRMRKRYVHKQTLREETYKKLQNNPVELLNLKVLAINELVDKGYVE